MYALVGGPDEATRARLTTLREAIESRRVLSIDYRDLKGQSSQRRLRPLGVFYWDAVWTLAAWCEWRQDFRSFRVDRIERVHALDEVFRDEPGKTLAELFRRVNAARSGSRGRARPA